MNNIKVNVHVDDNCCGILQVGAFQEGYYNMFSNEKPVKWNSISFEETLIDGVIDCVNENNTYPKGGYLLQCSLVSKYGANGTKQLPILQKYLVSSGWEPVIEFKNANTAHLVTVYYRLLPEEELKAYLEFFYPDTNEDEEEDYEDEEEDYVDNW